MDFRLDGPGRWTMDGPGGAPHLHLTMRVNMGRPPATRPEDLAEGVMESVVRNVAWCGDYKYRLHQCRTNCDLKSREENPHGDEKEVAAVNAAIAEAQVRVRLENCKIATGQLREQDLWECGDGDQSPLTPSECNRLNTAGWGKFDR